MIAFDAEATIHAPAESVYAALIDLERYREWNPWIIDASGTPRVGGPLVSAVAQLATRAVRVSHRIVAMTPARCFAWEDTGWFTLFAKGRRSRYLDAVSATETRFSQSLEIRGPLASLVRRRYGAALRRGIAAETAALKRRVEAAAREHAAVDP